MGGGPKYSRLKGIGRPTAGEYIDRVVVNSQKTIQRDETICPKCKFKAMYKFLRCPHCGTLVTVNKTKEVTETDSGVKYDKAQ